MNNCKYCYNCEIDNLRKLYVEWYNLKIDKKQNAIGKFKTNNKFYDIKEDQSCKFYTTNKVDNWFLEEYDRIISQILLPNLCNINKQNEELSTENEKFNNKWYKDLSTENDKLSNCICNMDLKIKELEEENQEIKINTMKCCKDLGNKNEKLKEENELLTNSRIELEIKYKKEIDKLKKLVSKNIKK